MNVLQLLVIATRSWLAASLGADRTRTHRMEGNQGHSHPGSTLDDQLIEPEPASTRQGASGPLKAPRASRDQLNAIVLLAGQVPPPGTEGPGRTGRQECATGQRSSITS